jgi:feruloyl esterase
MLYSLIEWVENGSSSNSSTANLAPESVVGTKFINDTPSLGVDFTRPICRWPDTAVFLGSGDVSDAGNWECTGKGVY